MKLWMDRSNLKIKKRIYDGIHSDDSRDGILEKSSEVDEVDQDDDIEKGFKTKSKRKNKKSFK